MDLLYPVKWIIELILVAFHSLFTFLGMDAADGFTWVLAITGLVLVVRAALIPLFVKQIKSQRGMVLLQPELQKLQKKYKGKTDRDSREAFAKEQMALYKKTGSNPLSSCLPLLAQMPIFISLFFTLNDAQHNKQGVGLLSQDLATSFANSEIFGAPLSASFFIPGTVQLNPDLVVQIIAGVMIVLMTASQFITQKQIISKNQTPANLQNSQYMQTQKIMLWLFPIMFAISGVSFPLGVMTYWLVSNFWTMGQQFVVIKSMPTPGSLAYDQRQARLEAKGKLPKPEIVDAAEIEIETKGQRQQPVSKKRKKK